MKKRIYTMFVLLLPIVMMAQNNKTHPKDKMYDFGDAPEPSFPSLVTSDGARHLWSIAGNIISPKQQAWLGKAPTNYKGGEPQFDTCSNISVDWEKNSSQIDSDKYDDGVHFFKLTDYTKICSTDSIDVTVTIHPEYDRTVPLLLHAWFDFNKDWYWDDQSDCYGDPTKNKFNEHIYWDSVRQLCPFWGEKLPVNNQTFEIHTGTSKIYKGVPPAWTNKQTCATYRLYFHTGFDSNSDRVFLKIITRFRLTPAISQNKINAVKKTGDVIGGEVEDYILEYGYEVNPAPREYCGMKVFDDRNGKTYNTVWIAHETVGQCWMKENLNVGTLISKEQSQTDNDIIEKYCYDSLEENCDNYGGLYQWDEAMNYASASKTNSGGPRGICPEGWHVPSSSEWNDLITICGGHGLSGIRMMEAGNQHWHIDSIGGCSGTVPPDNSSGFSALPGGCRDANDYNFSALHVNGIYWTCSKNENPPNLPAIVTFVAGEPVVRGTCLGSFIDKNFGFSVRCIKD